MPFVTSRQVCVADEPGEDEMVTQDPALVRREKAVRITMLLYSPKKSEKSQAPGIQEKTPQRAMFRENEDDE
jgi:hypothetical protein